MPVRINIPAGTQYGHLVTQGRYEMREGHSFEECKCICGKVAMFKANNLRSGNTLSCGCKKGTHRQSYTEEYGIWKSLKQRCLNPKDTSYARYGGRGITVCAAWRDSFQSFRRDMGPRPSPQHSIDRVDNDGPYAPWNCRWATQNEQQYNRGNNRHITFRGKTHTITEWANTLNMKTDLLHWRLKHWEMERALTQSVARRRRLL